MKSKIKKNIFRAYDIRGIVPQELTTKDAYELGRKIAIDLEKNHKDCKVIVGYDGRMSSQLLERELIHGLVQEGAKVYRLKLCPSPMLYYAMKVLNAEGAIMVTGSHNPSNYNGFKMLNREGNYLGKDILKLVNIKSKDKKKQGIVKNYNLIDSYLFRITKDINYIKNDIHIIWDAGNGATSKILETLVSLIPGKHELINNSIDGTFPSHSPDPTNIKNLKELKKTIIRKKADLGIAFDGDGDRIGVLDKNGKQIPGDMLILIFAEEILKKHKKAKIIFDIKASETLFHEVKKKGGIPIMWKTGHSFIKNKMKLTKALLAGEMSGHIFFADEYYGYDDALYAAIRLLKIYSKIRNFDKYFDIFSKYVSTPEIQIFCEDEKKFNIINEVTKIVEKKYTNFNKIDGIRVSTGYGWWLLRASNTQPALVIRVEAKNNDKLSALAEELKNILQAFNLSFKLE